MSGAMSQRVKLQLPATSANLGPGFDAAAVALDRYLEIEAEPADEFSIVCTGRDAVRCSRLEDNLILEIYKNLFVENDRPVTPLALTMFNGIPLGMGLGSSAAGRLAAIALANTFGGLGWDSDRILAEASALEGHPDNVAACWLGGFVIAASEGGSIHVARVEPPDKWRPILVLPHEPLATSKARAALPAVYPSGDVVENIQSAGLLGLAFAQGRGDLLRVAMRDRIHQPYRSAICPLLDVLLPLSGSHGILGVALSGAGPAVLAIADGELAVETASLAIREVLGERSAHEILVCRFESHGGNSFSG